jgi:hypothetical protein
MVKNSILLMSICVANFTVYASEDSNQAYNFNDFDKDVFTNHETKTIELFYPTPFVQSFDKSLLFVEKKPLEILLYAALTRITNKQSVWDLIGCNNSSGFAQTKDQEKKLEKYNDRNREYIKQLSNIYVKIKTIEKTYDVDSESVKISSVDFMTLVQYAAYKINYFFGMSEVIVNSDNSIRSFFHNDAHQLLILHEKHGKNFCTSLYKV